MKNVKVGIILFAVVTVLPESNLFAQMGMPSMGGMGGIGGGMGGGTGRPKRKLHKSRAPALSPSLNLLPEAATTIEGQFLLRQLPQEQALRQYQQTGKALERSGQAIDTLQQEVTQTQNQIRTGVKSTGHRTRFMSYGGYYSFSGPRGGGGGQ